MPTRKRRGASKGISRRGFLRAGLGTAGVMAMTGGAGHYGMLRLNEFGRYPADRLAGLRKGQSTWLFERYPGLAAHVPWRPIGSYPTPVEALPALAGATDVLLFVKRDDLSSPLYGGNKVRKLENILADADLGGRRTIVTAGATGTHHGLATALHGRELGFDVRLALYRQPVTPHAQRNLRGMLLAGADTHYGGGELGTLRAVHALYRNSKSSGGAPYFVGFGGTSRLGTIGHVNAALELAEQVKAGVMPEPDRIFVALGTCGTAAGLVAGCRLAGLRARVTAVRVTPPFIANRFAVQYLANDVLAFLRRSEPGMPRVRVRGRDFDVAGDQLGRGYAHGTETGGTAMDWARPRLALEPTYTAKALAACLDYCRQRARPGEVVLFWNTVNSAPVRQATNLDGVPEPLRAMLGA
ncbi:pyridoxal-phosphate dependent enzyme [soil metagenome]